MKKQKVWRVSVKERGIFTGNSYDVKADSAGEAEKKGLILARKDALSNPYCESVKLVAIIEA